MSVGDQPSLRYDCEMNESNQNAAIIVDDMFFAAKINAAAREAECGTVRVRTLDQLASLSPNTISVVIIDLNSDRVPANEAIAFFRSNNSWQNVPIVAFVSHVQTDLIRQAQNAGCNYVLPRSAFSQLLPRIVAGDLSVLQKE